MSKDAYYFSHDANARNDEKILMLRAEHGMAGYGIYWALVEMMFENSDTKLFHDKIRGMAVGFNVDITVLQNVINTCVTEELFTTDGEKFWSESLMNRKSMYHDAKAKKSAAGKKGMAKRWGNRDSDNTVITTDNNAITKDNKGKEIKENEIKENETKSPAKKSYSDLVRLTESEYERLVSEFGESIILSRIEDLDNYIGSSGKVYKDHNRVLRAWLKKDNLKKPAPVNNKPKAFKLDMTEGES